jgi:hypothetical protein
MSSSNGKPAQPRAADLMREAAIAHAASVSKAKREQEIDQTLGQLYSELNNSWAHVQQKLCGIVPPRECWAEYSTSGEGDQYRACLGLIKYRGEWRICHGFYDATEDSGPKSWKPIHDCAVSERVALIDHIDKLRNAIIAKAEESIPEVRSAVSKLAAVLERV